MLLMTHSSDTTFLIIENAAHGGAFGKNPIPEPTEAQCKAGNYKMGRVSLHGFAIAIEQPRGTYRTGIDPKTGKHWTSRMAAHYGYISGTKGADGDGIDCFVGPYPQSKIAYAINQYIDGRFDEHKIMLAFPDEETARNAYLHSYERGWKGLKSIIPLSINQLKWWLKHGNKSQPIKSENLPPEGLEAMTRKVHWDENAQPYNATIDQVLYEIRQSDSGENLLLDAVSIAEIIADSDGVLALDALVTPYIKLQRKMEVLQGVMERMGTGIKPVAMQITEPFKQFGVANVAVVYELSDGQTVSIYFHNPDATPNKLSPNDDVISYKWLLNKKDITIVVAPERGQDLNIREVARRILKLAEKNSPAFARANAKRADRMQNIQSLKDEIVVLEGELKSAQNELEIAKVAAEDKGNSKSSTSEEYTDQIKAAALWKGATMKVAAMLEGDKRASLELSRMTTKGDLDAYLMRKFGIDETAARDISNILTAQDIPADMTANLDNYKDEPWYSLMPTEQGQGSQDQFDPTSPEGYAKIMADPELQLNYQDALDSFFQERIIAVRNALRELGWDGEKFKDLSKNGVVAKFTLNQIRGTANLVGYEVNSIVDDLTKTPEQIAAEIDAAVPAGTSETPSQIWARIGMAHRYMLLLEADVIPGGYDSDVMPPYKSDLAARIDRLLVDGWTPDWNVALEYFKTHDTMAGNGEMMIDAINHLGGEYRGYKIVESDSKFGGHKAYDANGSLLIDHMNISFILKTIDDAIASPSNSTESNPVASENEVPPASEIEVESEDMKAAREFLKSVIDGDKDKDDLMALLDKIEASANAIIEAGKGEEFDALIGQAAERWAELDKQANG